MRKQILAHGRTNPFLPEKSSTSTSSLLLPEVVKKRAFHAANESIATATAECGKRKRGPYHHYDAKVWAAKYASENGIK